MTRFARLLRSSIGRKVLMAGTGLALLGFVIGHLLGNLLVFQGPEALNAYAAWLQSKPPMLWTARIGLLVVFSLHVYLGLTLALENRAARPDRYTHHAVVQTTISSRTIALSGLVVLAFLVFHLLHFTFGVIDPAHTHPNHADGGHDVYGMVVHGFQNPLIAGSYIVAMLLLGMHLKHGTASLFQTVGINHSSYTPLIHKACLLLVALIVLGNCSIPLLILMRVVGTVGGD